MEVPMGMNPGKFVKQLKRSEHPNVLKVEGNGASVVLDLVARSDASEGIRQGADDLAGGRHRPAREALAEFRNRHGIPR